MKTRILFTLLIIANLNLGQVSAESSPNAPALLEVPFQMEGPLVVVRGSVGSLSNLRVLIDTGTSLTLINQRLVNRLDRQGQGLPAK